MGRSSAVDLVRSFRPSPAASSFRLELTTRETEVLQLLADGLRTKQVAQRLHVSQETIKSHIVNIVCKLDATNRTHAVTIGVRAGLID
jgi:two-component system, NarL family, response regulator YdfI